MYPDSSRDISDHVTYPQHLLPCLVEEFEPEKDLIIKYGFGIMSIFLALTIEAVFPREAEAIVACRVSGLTLSHDFRTGDPMSKRNYTHC